MAIDGWNTKKDKFLASESDVYYFWESIFRTLKELEWNMEIFSIPCESDNYNIQLLWYNVFIHLVLKKREENYNLNTQFLFDFLSDKQKDNIYYLIIYKLSETLNSHMIVYKEHRSGIKNYELSSLCLLGAGLGYSFVLCYLLEWLLTFAKRWSYIIPMKFLEASTQLTSEEGPNTVLAYIRW